MAGTLLTNPQANSMGKSSARPTQYEGQGNEVVLAFYTPFTICPGSSQGHEIDIYIHHFDSIRQGSSFRCKRKGPE